MKPLFNEPSCVKDETQGTHGTQLNSGCGIAKSIAVAQAPSFQGSTFVRAPAIADFAGTSTDLDATGGITLTLNGSGARAIKPVAPIISLVSVNATTTEASTVMAYTRPRVRGEAALSRDRRSHKIFPTERGALRVHDGREFAGTIVPIGVDTVDAVEWPYEVFDQRDRPVGMFGDYREALRAGPIRERAS